MFNIGMSEFIVLGAIALIFIGPKQLPEVARMVGRLINEMKRVSEEVFGSLSDVQLSAKRLMDETEKTIQNEAVFKEPEEPDPPIVTGGHNSNPRFNFTHEELAEAEAKQKQKESEEKAKTEGVKPDGQ